MRDYQFKNYKRITKATARKLFLAGERIYIAACNMNLDSQWNFYPYSTRRAAHEMFVIDEEGINNRFTALVNSFEYYNCDNERGRYAAFYVAK